MNAYTEKPKPINWDYYTRNISKPNLVEDFAKQFKALSVPYPKDTATAEIETLQRDAVIITVLRCRVELSWYFCCRKLV